MKNDNIVLIGMPGAGKSTLGVLLAKAVNCRFVDTDLIIQEKEGRLLCDIIREEGQERFKEIEDRVNAELEAEHSVIAPGGSVVYGERAMRHLKEIGTVVYLELSLAELENRLGDLTKRGVVFAPGQDLKALYAERTALYEKYADVTVACDGKETGVLLLEIMEALPKKVSFY